nr:hypothetical protein [Paraburkholderia gardini]
MGSGCRFNLKVRDGRRGTGRRAAWRAPPVDWISRDGWRQIRVLRRRGLAEYQRAGIPQHGNDRGIRERDVIRAGGRAAASREAGDIDDVLHANRQAGERLSAFTSRGEEFPFDRGGIQLCPCADFIAPLDCAFEVSAPTLWATGRIRRRMGHLKIARHGFARRNGARCVPFSSILA